MSLRRGFVALVPSAGALDHVEMAVAPLREEFPKLRWMPRAQWHVTLQFLGRVDDADAVVDGLRAAASDVASFDVRLGGGGAFAKARAGTVLWVGVAEGGDAMGALAGAVMTATTPLRLRGRGSAVPSAPHARALGASDRSARCGRRARCRGSGPGVDRLGDRAVRERHATRRRGAHRDRQVFLWPSVLLTRTPRHELLRVREAEGSAPWPCGALDDLVVAGAHADLLAGAHHDVGPALPHADEGDLGDHLRLDHLHRGLVEARGECHEFVVDHVRGR